VDQRTTGDPSWQPLQYRCQRVDESTSVQCLLPLDLFHISLKLSICESVGEKGLFQDCMGQDYFPKANTRNSALLHFLFDRKGKGREIFLTLIPVA
jgi:hypothetical protein